jgi:hypothetical protein
MAVLVESDRVSCWADWMQQNLEEINITKQDLRDAVDATDDWIDTNASSYNTAIPEPARSALTARQKLLLFTIVAFKRFGVS